MLVHANLEFVFNFMAILRQVIHEIFKYALLHVCIYIFFPHMYLLTYLIDVL